MDTREGILYRFGEFELSPTEHRVTRNGQSVKLTPKAFDLLLFLVERPGRLLTKEEIFKQVWPDVAVQDSSLTAAISTIRKELGENPENECIKTVHTKGYRFDAKVVIIRNGKVNVVPDIAVSSMARHGRLLALTTVAVVLIFSAVLVGRIAWQKARESNAKLYQRASELERSGNDKLALETLNELIRLEPAAVGPRVQAAWIAYDDGENDLSKSYLDELAKQVASRAAGAKGATPDAAEEVVQLQADALRSVLAGSNEDAIRKLQVALNRDPRNVTLLYRLSMLELDQGLYQDSEAASSECLRMDATDGLCRYLRIQASVYQDHFADALRERQEAANRSIDYPWLDEPAAYASLALDDQAAALAGFHRIEDAGRRYGSDLHFRAAQDGIAAVALYRGRLNQAKRQLEEATEASTSEYNKAAYLVYLAQIDSLHGNTADAYEEIQAALSHSDANDIVLDAAKAFAAIGKAEQADRLLNGLEKKRAPLGRSLSGARQFVDATKDEANGDYASALDRLADAYHFDDSVLTGYYLARVQMRLAKWNEASGTLRTIADSKGRVLMDGVPSLFPLVVLDLGICNSRLGNQAEAERNFKEAADLWQDADPILKHTLADRATKGRNKL
jgi:DNA-binding winged helix-turn-helix (wHTH) protein/predicted Zn-dependent protease